MSTTQTDVPFTVSSRPALEIALPAPDSALTQDAEWVVVRTDDGWKRIRLHDYASVFSVPGLYERWVYDVLRCTSPAKIRELLEQAVSAAGMAPADVSVLDLGAGNGFVAEELRSIKFTTFVGIDIHQEAADAAERDRPGLYADYVVGDMTNLDAENRQKLDRHSFNCLTCVAALGFGDIPPEVFAAAFNEIEHGGLVAFTIKDDFVDEADDSGFKGLINQLLKTGTLDVISREPYVHRISTNGEDLIYVAFVGRKRRDIDMDWARAQHPS